MAEKHNTSLASLLEIRSLILYNWKNGLFNWIMVFYISMVHVTATIGLFKIPYCSAETLIWGYTLMVCSGLGITVGAHRLWSHNSFQACFLVRLILMLFNSIANQGSIFHWSRDHRVHHKYSETDADPYNAKRGFFFAHIGWLLVKKNESTVKAGREHDLTDLLEDPLVLWQKKVDPWFSMYMCYIFPSQVAVHMWGEKFWNAFFVAGALKYCLVLHLTWFVNSAAHLWGDRPYDTTSYPAENPMVAYCLGEGWHNWHHKYPFDYAASEFGVSSQFNPSKLLIDVLAIFGLVWGRKRATATWALGKARRDRERENGIPMGKLEPRPWEVSKCKNR